MPNNIVIDMEEAQEDWDKLSTEQQLELTMVMFSGVMENAKIMHEALKGIAENAPYPFDQIALEALPK